MYSLAGISLIAWLYYSERLRTFACIFGGITLMIAGGIPSMISCIAGVSYVGLEYVQLYLWLCIKMYFKIILWICGTKINVIGAEHLDKDKKYIFMSNHTSVYDIPVIFDALPF
jgi:1-acyl-sn-glycerol-3-phosphate acyltransferase